MESASLNSGGREAVLHVQMLGPLLVSRGGAPLRLPASRKVRALLAYLALAPQALGRGHLCELLWDVPNDPRGELRWCLSKLRGLLDEPGRRRVVARDDLIELDLSACRVDAVEIAQAAAQGIATLGLDRLRELSRLFAGDFLEGLEIGRNPPFGNWLGAQRRRFRACHVAVQEHLVRSLPAASDEIFPAAEKWITLAPFDKQAHSFLLAALMQRGRPGECEEHLAATARRFESEALDFGPLRDAWRRIKEGQAATSRSAHAVSMLSVLPLPGGSGAPADVAPRRVSLAVMPFLEQTQEDGSRGGLADGLTHDIITRLAKLRSLFVIARGSVFALAERSIGAADAGRRLEVDYVASGTLRRQTGRAMATVELMETRTARIVWTEVFDQKLDDAFLILDEIGSRIVSAIAGEIETAERNRAILKPPASLNAWEAYHRGLWHMYRFTKTENDQARHFFEMALRLDPTFSRAYAGLSFTHWQSAFQRWADREQESDLAFKAAGQGLIVDDHDPAAHWAMGRALWLRGRQDASLAELEKAVELSPSFALGHYSLSFVRAQSGDPAAAIGSSDHSRRLSPFDPLLFAMLSARALAHVRLGEFEEAASWALKGAARPNAHATILAIAAYCLALAGRVEEARAFMATIRKSLPAYGFDDFLGTFQFPADTAALFRQGAQRIGLA